jgi:hypothetical protein
MKRKISKALKKLCKQYHVRLTVKRGSKLVYKSEKAIVQQLKRRMRRRSRFGKRPSRFGACGCKANGFGRKKGKSVKRVKHGKKDKKDKKSIRKLHKLCKLYGIKIGKKSPKLLKKQCIKRITMLIKKEKKKKSHFGSLLNFVAGTGDATDRQKSDLQKQQADIKLAQIEKIETLKLQNQGANAVALAQIEANRKIEQQKMEMEKQKYKDEMKIREIEAKALRDCAKQSEIKAQQEAKKKQKEAEQAAKEAEKLAKQSQKAVDNHAEAKNDVQQAAAFGKKRRNLFGNKR